MGVQGSLCMPKPVRSSGRALLPFCWCVLVVALALFIAPWAGATDRFYPDRVVLSPDRTLRLEAKSPDNVDHRPFANNFVYTLHDSRKGTVRWTHTQAGDEGSPMEIEVSDRGDVAAIVAGEQLLLLSAGDGKPIQGPRILESISEAEWHSFVSTTTAGPMWREHSVLRFFDTTASSTAGEGHYIGLRTFWERRLVVDLANGALVDIGAAARDAGATQADAVGGEKQAAIVAALLASESTWAKEVIGFAAKHDPYEPVRRGDFRSFHALRSAVHLVGCRRLKEFLPQLRTLEAAISTEPSEVDALRSVIHLSIRRLGETPSVPTGRELTPYRKTDFGWAPDHEAAITKAIPFAERAARSASIKEGMTMAEVGALIGPPDATFYDATLREHCIDWDLDSVPAPKSELGTSPIAAPPSTLRIAFDLETSRVKALRRFVPAIWVAGYEREMGRLANP
jgi:hypothetical protein